MIDLLAEVAFLVLDYLHCSRTDDLPSDPEADNWAESICGLAYKTTVAFQVAAHGSRVMDSSIPEAGAAQIPCGRCLRIEMDPSALQAICHLLSALLIKPERRTPPLFRTSDWNCLPSPGCNFVCMLVRLRHYRHLTKHLSRYSPVSISVVLSIACHHHFPSMGARASQVLSKQAAHWQSSTCAQAESSILGLPCCCQRRQD